jgi:predicted DNA binding protein
MSGLHVDAGMKSLRLTGRPDPAFAPAVFRLVADSPHVEEARLVGWNLADDAGGTVLFAVEGDVGGFRAAIPDDPAVSTAEAAAIDDGRFVFLLRVTADESSLLATMLSALGRGGLVVVKPVVYRDGEVDARVVGEDAAVQAFIEAFPPAVEVDIREVGSGGVDPTAPVTALSDRQREAVMAALDLGYYDSPKRATHEDVARALDCAPSTASEHLRKAEAKLVRRAIDGVGPR